MKVKEWEDRIVRNTPKGFPTLVCGWTDEEYGFTHDAYVTACIERIEDLCPGQSAPEFKTFENWKRDKRDQDEYRDDLGFSHLECDLCGAKAGERYAVTALPINPAENPEYVALSVCGDCLCYIANGDVPDWLEGEND